MSACICCIAKYEECYLEEWIRYNIALGFSSIYIYDNSDNGKALEYLASTPGVQVIPFPGKVKQRAAYAHFVNNYRNTHTWCAFIDCDEFIVLRKHPNIVSFLQQHCPYGGLALNWIMFGSNGKTEYDSQPVTQRFTRRCLTVNPHIKSIVVLKHCFHIDHPHFAIMIKRMPTRDTNGKVVVGAFNENGPEDIACIYHYFTKSREEFREKVNRGRANTTEIRNFEKEFIASDINDIEDFSAWNFYKSTLQQ